MLVAIGALVLLGGCSSPPEVAPTAPPTSAVPDGGSPTSPPTDGEPSDEGRVDPTFAEFDVTAGSHPHDVAPAADGSVWFTGQHRGYLGRLDPASGEIEEVPLGSGSAPHGVIVGPDGGAWVTDGGLNAIVRVDPGTLDVAQFPLPRPSGANLNTAAFDGDGILWFTGQAGIYGRLDPASGTIEVFDAPRGQGPYGIAATPEGDVWFASLAGSYIARVASDGTLETVDVPTPGGGARRVWSDSRGRLWVTEWFAGALARYDPASRTWDEWELPGEDPQPYAVYVDDEDVVWVTDFGGDALVRFDPTTETFDVHPWPTAGAAVRQLLGRTGEVWGTGSAIDTVIVARTG